MADPFSIVGLVMTTLKTINTAKNFVDNVHRAPRSINTLRDELSDIEDRLRQLGQIITEERADEKEMYQLLSVPMGRCEKISIQVEKMIRPYVKTSGGITVWGRFAFGFKESEVQLVHRELEGCKSSLSMAITSANLLTDRKTSHGFIRLQNHFGIEHSSVATDDMHERNREDIKKYIEETIAEEDSESVFSNPEKPQQRTPSPALPEPNLKTIQSSMKPFLTIDIQHNNRTYPIHVRPDDTIEMIKRQIRNEHLELIHIQDLETLDGGILAGGVSIEYYSLIYGTLLKAILSEPTPQKPALVSLQSLPASKLVPAQGLIRQLSELRTFKLSQKLKGYMGAWSIAFSSDGRRLASGCLDNTIRIWADRRGKLEQVQELKGHGGEARSIAFSPDGCRLASGSLENRIRIWADRQGKLEQVQELEGHNGLSSVAFSPDGRRLASGSLGCTIRIWADRQGKLEQVQELKGRSFFSSIAFSPDGRRLASGGYDNIIRIWADRRGKLEQVQELKGHSGEARSIAFSPDGRRLASGSLGNTIRIWPNRQGKSKQGKLEQAPELKSHSGLSWIWSVAFSPNGCRLASAGSDSTIRIWADRQGRLEQVQELKGHSSVRSVAFSPDGCRLASAGLDNTIRIWADRQGKLEQVQELKGHSGPTVFAFSPDGCRLASAGFDNTIQVWEVETV